MIKNSCPKGYSHGTSYVDADCIHGSKEELHADMIQKYIEECERYKNMIYLQEEILKGLVKTKNKVDEKLKTLKGLEYKVMYLKMVEGMNLQEIASKLGYSYQYIREIASKTYKEPTTL